MGDVIEACEDGGFDIPATSITHTRSRPSNRSSEVVGHVEAKVRRIKIQLEDDDDDDDDNDDSDSGDDRDATSQTRTTAGEMPEVEKGEPRTSASSGHDVAGKIDGEEDAAVALDLPEYKIYKIEPPGEDPLLEIVVSLSKKNTTTGTPPTSTSAASDKRSAASPTLPAPKVEGDLKETPSVSISSDGIRVVVDPNPAANGSRGEGRAGGGGGTELARKCSLRLPQRVVPRTAKSFFQEGTLTVRAVVAAG